MNKWVKFYIAFLVLGAIGNLGFLVGTDPDCKELFFPTNTEVQNSKGLNPNFKSEDVPCSLDSNCGDNGYCRDGWCKCNDDYITRGDDEICNYKLRSQLVAFLLSLFVGGLGVDW
jgi:hypothetical protein